MLRPQRVLGHADCEPFGDGGARRDPAGQPVIDYYSDDHYQWRSNFQHPGLGTANGLGPVFATWEEGHRALMEVMRDDYEDLYAQHPALRQDTDREWRRAMAMINLVEQNQPYSVFFNGWLWWLVPDLK
jgi:hypothetical protein